MDNQKLYVVTIQDGPDSFKELVFGLDMDEAREAAELRFDGKCVNVRRAACHPGREVRK